MTTEFVDSQLGRLPRQQAARLRVELPSSGTSKHSPSTLPRAQAVPVSQLMKKFIGWSVASVVAAIALDVWLINQFPLASPWLHVVVLSCVTIPMLLLWGQFFVRQAKRQEWSIRRRDARQWMSTRRDPLTQADNRHAFKELLSAMNRDMSGSPAALFVLDLHDFQRVNDACGHRVGDEVLRETCRRLRSPLFAHRQWVKATDPYTRWLNQPRVVRVGSDELALWFPHWPATADAQLAAQDILNAIEKPYRVAGFNLHIRGSVGYVTDRTGQLEGSDWLTRANMATQQAKRLGTGHAVAFCDEQMEGMRRRHGLLQALQDTLQTGKGFSLEYQPIVSLELRALMGCEALLRWKHPQWGWISPAEFIPIAEGSDLIRPLGRWVLKEAVGQLAEWNRRMPASAMLRMKMSVNLSRDQLHDPELIPFVEHLLKTSRVPASALRLEVTESLPLDDRKSVETLQQLRLLGLSLALDDFGTGYSSLSALMNLPIRSVKIDRVFVSGIDGCSFRQALVAGVLRVAQEVGLDVVAEGIEREEEAAMLAKMGCHQMQGWLVSRSLPAQEFASRWLSPMGDQPVLIPLERSTGCQDTDCGLKSFGHCPSPPAPCL